MAKKCLLNCFNKNLTQLSIQVYCWRTWTIFADVGWLERLLRTKMLPSTYSSLKVCLTRQLTSKDHWLNSRLSTIRLSFWVVWVKTSSLYRGNRLLNQPWWSIFWIQISNLMEHPFMAVLDLTWRWSRRPCLLTLLTHFWRVCSKGFKCCIQTKIRASWSSHLIFPTE